MPIYNEASLILFGAMLLLHLILQSFVFRKRWVYVDELPGHLPGGRTVVRFLGKDEDGDSAKF